MARILVIDDERAIRNTLKEILEFEGYTVDVAEDGKAGIEAVRKQPYDLVYCDVKMPGMDGIEVLEQVEDTTFIMISGHATVETAVEALKKGAFDFLEKPIDLNRLLVTTKNALDRHQLQTEVKTKTEEVHKLRRQLSRQNEMVGESEAIRRVREVIDKVAATDARVLISGCHRCTCTHYRR